MPELFFLNLKKMITAKKKKSIPAVSYDVYLSVRDEYYFYIFVIYSLHNIYSFDICIK